MLCKFSWMHKVPSGIMVCAMYIYIQLNIKHIGMFSAGLYKRARLYKKLLKIQSFRTLNHILFNFVFLYFIIIYKYIWHVLLIFNKYSSIQHIRLRHIRQSAIYDMEASVPRIFLSLPCIFIWHIQHPVYTTFAIYDIFSDPLGLIVLYISNGIYDI